MALTLLKAPRISNITDQSEQAQDLNALYDLVAESVMSLGPWPSCCVRAELARATETPAFGFDYYYQLPTNPKFLRLLEVDEELPGLIKFQIDGDKLATDEDEIAIRYISFQTDTAKYDPYLKQSIIEHLMAYIVYGQTGDRNSFLSSLGMAKTNAMKAISFASAQTGSKDLNLGDDYTSVREG